MAVLEISGRREGRAPTMQRLGRFAASMIVVSCMATLAHGADVTGTLRGPRWRAVLGRVCPSEKHKYQDYGQRLVPQRRAVPDTELACR
jgi:hypothetical protein